MTKSQPDSLTLGFQPYNFSSLFVAALFAYLSRPSICDLSSISRKDGKFFLKTFIFSVMFLWFIFALLLFNLIFPSSGEVLERTC